MSVLEGGQWGEIANACRIPKSVHDRGTKLDNIYCKYLLPYVSLSKKEREEFLKRADQTYQKYLRGEIVKKPKRKPHRSGAKSSASKKYDDADSDNSSGEDEFYEFDCFVTGKSVSLGQYYRLARNISSQWLPDPEGLDVENRFWNIIEERDKHVCVHEAHIDTSEFGFGFPAQKNKHPWNLKNLSHSTSNVLRSMGSVIGVTAPTLHIAMLYSCVCWYRDPHNLPWIEYLHSGAPKIWYSISSQNEASFNSAMKKLVPNMIREGPFWLPADTTMVSPATLSKHGVTVTRVVQYPGQFILVLPGAFTSSLSTGYTLSESVYFARQQYLDRVEQVFSLFSSNREPAMFSLERLVIGICSDNKCNIDTLTKTRPILSNLIDKFKIDFEKLKEFGVSSTNRPCSINSNNKLNSRAAGTSLAKQQKPTSVICELCRQEQFISFVGDARSESSVLCMADVIAKVSESPLTAHHYNVVVVKSLPELQDMLSQVDERLRMNKAKR